MLHGLLWTLSLTVCQIYMKKYNNKTHIMTKRKVIHFEDLDYSD